MKLVHLVLPLVAGVIVCRSAVPAQAAIITKPTVIAAAALSGTRDLGRANGSTKVSFSVVLPYQHATDLAPLLKAQSTRGSAEYRHFMTAAQFRNYFSPTPAAYAAAVAQLVKAGFSVETFSNRTVVHATGSATAADAFFHTTIDRVLMRDGRPAFANVTAATVPPGLGRVVGLNGIVNAKTTQSQRTSGTHPAIASKGPLFGPDGGFGPLAIAKAGDFPIEHGYTGYNSNVADIIDGQVIDSDVVAFLKEFGLKRGGPRTTEISVDGGCGPFCFDTFTADADAEWTLAVAPNASLFVYQIPELTNAGIVDGFNAVVSDDAVNVVNFSVGACEIQGADLQLALQPVIAQGAAEGITIESVAFGGANLCGAGIDLPMTPANLDTVTAVGGSTAFVEPNGKQVVESAFSNSNGGVSVTIDVPAWQAPTPGVNPAGRNVPDLVVPGSVDGTGPSLYFEGAWVGGSAYVNNAPIAGYLATVQEMYGYATPLGNVAPAIYGTFDKTSYTSKSVPYFTDVELGSIGAVNGVPVLATAGYDLASGIGSIAGGYALAESFAFGPISPPTP